jgi:hypothetical protein
MIGGLSILDLDGDRLPRHQYPQDLDQPFLDAQGNGTAVAATPYAVARGAASSSRGRVGSPRPDERRGRDRRHHPGGLHPQRRRRAGDVAYVYSATGLSVSKVSLVSRTQVATASIGPTPLGQSERIGAHLFNSAQFAVNRTFACASCHPDGHLDGLVWKLNTHDGLRATQTIQEISETAPYHWDGSKCNLVKILQDGITGLFANPVEPTSCEMKTMIDWMDGLVGRGGLPATRDHLGVRGWGCSSAAWLLQGRERRLRPVHGRLRDPAVEQVPLRDGRFHNGTFRFGAAAARPEHDRPSCAAPRTAASHRWVRGFASNEPERPLADGFQAVSTLNAWDGWSRA